MPSAKKKHRCHRACRDDIRIFGKEKERKFHRAIFGVIAANKFRLGFGKIEGKPVCLRERGDEKEEKANRRADDIPKPRRLGRDNRIEIERTAQHHHTKQPKAEREFVTNHLRARTEPAQKRIFRSARPPRERNAIDAERR